MTAVLGRGRARSRAQAIEWPSLLLCTAVYGGFATLTWFNGDMPTGLVILMGSLLLTLHSSMQHEFIHGHPTPWRRFNRALATAPLSLWLPFESYRRSHLVHHCDEQLTDPLDDPESYYWSASQWAALGPIGRVIVRAHTTLAGRLLLGPAWNILRYLRSEYRAVAAGDHLRRRMWGWHLIHVAVVLIWTLVVCRMNVLVYLTMIYAGTSVLLMRSFAEHRANHGVFERTAIVEKAWFFGPLFLFNNLHAAHHERPLIPWYQLPGWYKANRHRLVVVNGGLVYNGYWDVARSFLLTPHDVVIHPAEAQRAEGIASAILA